MGKIIPLTFMLIMALVTTLHGQQQAEDHKVYVYTRPTPEMIEGLLDLKGFEYERMDSSLFKVNFEYYSLPVRVKIDVDDNLLVFTAFSKKSPSMETINDFNSSYRFSKVYYDKNGILTLSRELSFTGGGLPLRYVSDVIDFFNMACLVL